MECESVATRNLQEGVMVLNCLMGKGVYSGVIKMFWNQTDVVVAAHVVKVLNVTGLFHFKVIKFIL